MPAVPEKAAESRFNRTVILLMSLGFLAILASGLMAGLVMLRNEDRSRWVTHTYEVEREVSGIRLALEEMRSGRRGVILMLGPEMRARFDQASKSLDDGVRRFAALTRDNPRQQAKIAGLASSVRELQAVMRSSLGVAAERSAAAEARRQAAATAVAQIADTMLSEERRLLRVRLIEQRNAARLFYFVLGIAGVVLVLVAVGSIAAIRRYTYALGESRDALRSLNENLEGAVRERTVDLQRANEEIQRFAYIVSHDLRSPLVNVLGFTGELEAAGKMFGRQIDRLEVDAPDLIDNDARIAAREDLPEAIGFIRSSTQKMDRLINAILKLSREGRRTIAAEELDMDAVAQGVIDALHHRTQELGATITVRTPLPALFADRLAVEQILSNLVENAVKYLRPGVPGQIEVRGKRSGERVLLKVVDNGRGIDPRDHDRVFDLFRRSGVQDQPGEGIGLAHVRALAYRIGGTISVESELGAGATFIVNLPARFAGEQGAIR